MKLIRFLLFPFAILYDLITSIRNYCFDTQIFKSTSFNKPIIAVGNLSVGGTGKTPQIEYLIRLLLRENKLAILSRGYKRKLKGNLILNEKHTAQDVGDEPFQFFKKFDSITVSVDSDRVNGVRKLLQLNPSPDVILLDDAFQHRKIKAGFYILLTKYDDLFVDDFLLPTGYLRESSRGAKRADVIVVTKCPEDLNVDGQKEVIKKLSKNKTQPIFFTKISYADIVKNKTQEIPVKSLKNYNIVLVTGIANPTPLLKYLKNLGIDYNHMQFADHHDFSKNDVLSIQSKLDALKGENKIILTTEKDYVRLSNLIENVFFLTIETAFISKGKSFDEMVFNYIKNE